MAIKLTRFERTRLISTRALQLALGAPPLVKAKKGMTPLDVAALELEKKAVLLFVIRKFPDGNLQKVLVS